MSSRRIPNLDPDQLDCFLGIVTDRTDSTFKSTDDKAVADLVHKVLNSPLGKHSVFPDHLQDRLRHFTQAFSDKSLIDMVLDSKTEPVILKAISYCAQEYSFYVSTQAENAIAITIYYAAIASLLVHHNKEIFEHSYENLIESFTDLMKKRWLVLELKQHLDSACKICQQKQDSKETDEKRLSDDESLKLSNLRSRRNSTSNHATSSLDILVNGVGGWIGRYKLLNVLGEGGMGIVYLAEQKEPIRRRVALKIIKPGMDSKRVIARFEAERQALALLDHPNIAHVHDAGTTENSRHYFVMEYVRGLTITEHCDKHQFTIEERLLLFKQICDAVQYAHQKGIIHRDIKPSNILVSAEEDKVIPKIIDFGVAKAIAQPLTDRTLVTEQGQLFGTLEYMSPEQADMINEDIDTRSDIYSLGVLLYVLMTGVLPLDSKTFRESGIEHIRQVIREIDPKTPSNRLTNLGEAAKKIAESRRTKIEILVTRLRRELEWIPLKAMRKERSERYRSASELADDVENYLKGNPLIAGPPSTVYRLKKLVRRNAALSSAILTAVVTLVIGLITTTAMYVQADHARAEAQAVSDFLRKDVLWSLDLWRTGGQEINVRSVLDAVSEKLEGKFADKPLVEASIRRELGATYTFYGLYEAAERQFNRTLNIHRAQLGAKHQATLISMWDVGWVYWWQSRYHEAEPLLTKALEGMELTLDEDNEDRLYCMAMLAWLYDIQGRFNEAEQLFSKGLSTLRRVLGEENVYSPTFMQGLAWAYGLQGHHDKAERLYNETLELSRRVRGEQDFNTLSLMNHLGDLYHNQGRYDEAEQLLNEAVDSTRHVMGEKHLLTLEVMDSLARLYHSQCRYEEAESYLDPALKTSLQVLGDEHFCTANCLHTRGSLHLSQSRYDEAEACLKKALKIMDHILGKKNWATLRIMNTLAKLYTAQGHYVKAEESFLETIETRKLKLGDDHPDTLETKNDLAVLYKEQDRYQEAESLLLEAIEGRRLKLGDTHPHIIESMNNLIALYEAWNKPEKAQEWRAKLQQTEALRK